MWIANNSRALYESLVFPLPKLPKISKFAVNRAMIGGMWFVIRVIINAIALWVTTALIPGVDLETGSDWEKFWTLLLVGLIFGIVNAVLKPIAFVLGFPLYVLTLGLFALVVNALLFWFTGWLSESLDLSFHVDGFWPAFWGAIIMAIVSWLLSLGLRAASD